MASNTSTNIDCDVVLIGAGIMSATLGVFLKELQPDWKVEIFERLDRVAGESSDAWNNAGTGHSALCELNYTPPLADGSIDISKAIKIAEQFEVSKQFWSFLVQQGFFSSPHQFINSIPHMSLVWGDENVAYLKKRYEAMLKCHLFEGMQFSDNPEQLEQWIPLIMKGRNTEEKIAATRIEIGTDVNFGELTRCLFSHLKGQHDVAVNLNHEVYHFDKVDTGWQVRVKDLDRATHKLVNAKFVFIGAGGGSLPLLEKSHISEGKGFGGFPVSGQWLICKNREVIERHHAKVYGKAATGSPPMSVPHLDTRIIDGKHALLFGPYAGFSTRFLKEGSLMDLPMSIQFSNMFPMLAAGAHNIALTKYLIEQLSQSPEDRFNALKEFFPEAKMEDWELAVAGQRVQVIKKDIAEGGILEFGTEVVCSADGSMAALLGASPGASTSVSIMLDVLCKCFKEMFQSAGWQASLKEMIPTFGKALAGNAELAQNTRAFTHEVLGLKGVVITQ